MINKNHTVTDNFNKQQAETIFDLFDGDDDDEIELNLDDIAGFDEEDTEDSDDDIPAEWDLISAFNVVLLASRHNEGKLSGGKRSQSAMDFLKGKLQMNDIQVIVIAMLIDNGQSMSWAGMAHFLDITRITMMTYTDDIEALVDKHRWLINKASHERNGLYEGFALVPGVIRALRHNKVFQPENLSNLDEQTFVERMASRIECCSNNAELNFSDTERWLDYLVGENKHLPLCQAYNNLEGDIHNKCLLLLFIADYAKYANRPNEGLSMRSISSFFPEDWECQGLRTNLEDQSHELFQKGYIENRCEDGIADAGAFVLTQKAKEELIPLFRPHSSRFRKSRSEDRDLLRHEKIVPKQLFYNAREGEQIERLKQILSQEQFPQIQQRLADRGMRTGVAVLLSGGPGTGKTESVRQIARETGRDLLMIDISQVKDKFVGESEKNTKAIFDRYKSLCKSCQHPSANIQRPIPILFINECDAILGKRMENAEHSADKMQNSMQNILLQALEDLEGVIICTTNLASSLDPAFERRFLMKVEFSKPDTDVRAHIWQSMIPSLTDSQAHCLAEQYSFSGGQCENVMRKATIDEIINGKESSFSQLDSFCKEELTNQKTNIHPIAGFTA